MVFKLLRYFWNAKPEIETVEVPNFYFSTKEDKEWTEIVLTESLADGTSQHKSYDVEDVLEIKNFGSEQTTIPMYFKTIRRSATRHQGTLQAAEESPRPRCQNQYHKNLDSYDLDVLFGTGGVSEYQSTYRVKSEKKKKKKNKKKNSNDIGKSGTKTPSIRLLEAELDLLGVEDICMGLEHHRPRISIFKHFQEF